MLQGKRFAKSPVDSGIVLCLSLMRYLPLRGINFSSHPNKKTTPAKADVVFCWRSGWDSNPRAREGQRFSRPPRYDRFDTAADKTGGEMLQAAASSGGLKKVEAPSGFEPESRGFAVRCLTTWLWRHWSGQRDSNSLPPPWQGGALPNELCPQMVPQARIELATRGFSVRCSTY